MSDDGGRRSSGSRPRPFWTRSESIPYLTASPWVLVEDGRWRMWYVSGSDWRATTNGVDVHVSTPSRRRRALEADGRVCIDYRDEHETAIARPCVVRDGDAYRMWFCSRGDAYRLGYAESLDGLTWTRHDDEIEISRGNGWDSEMQAYPFVFDHDGNRHMLYNGNGYGATGIGHAVLERWATAVHRTARSVGAEGFPDEAFEQLAALEDRHFWFRTAARLLVWALEAYFARARSLLEVGCGTGVVLDAIGKSPGIPTRWCRFERSGAAHRREPFRCAIRLR